MSDDKESGLGLLLKSLMKEKALSMRRLSVLIDMDTATISRIINGKQTARAEHLKKFASFFDVSMKALMEADGLDLNHKEAHSDMHASVAMIQEVLGGSNLFDQQHITTRVEQVLEDYERYAQTEEGRRIIHEGFQMKVQQVDGTGPFIEHLKQMYAKFASDNGSNRERAILGSGLLYFILSTDIIPDYVFPIGYIDDAIAVKLVLNRLDQLDNE